MASIAKGGGSQSGKPCPRFTAPCCTANGENSCHTVGRSSPSKRGDKRLDMSLVLDADGGNGLLGTDRVGWNAAVVLLMANNMLAAKDNLILSVRSCPCCCSRRSRLPTTPRTCVHVLMPACSVGSSFHFGNPFKIATQTECSKLAQYGIVLYGSTVSHHQKRLCSTVNAMANERCAPPHHVLWEQTNK